MFDKEQMESLIASGEDQRIPELDVSAFQNQASYVISRTQTTTTCPTPAVKPDSVRSAVFRIVDSNFLDLSTLHFTFVVENLDGDNKALRPLSAIPHCWWRRLTIKVNGSVCEDIANLSRIEEQITRFTSTNKRRNWGTAGSGWETLTDEGIDAYPETIAKGSPVRVVWRPVSSGFLQCGKYLPMLGGAAGGLELTIECADFTDACLNSGGNLSEKWQLKEIQCHVDSVQLASEMTASYADMLVQGEGILIPFQANSCDVQYLSGQDNIVLSVAKQFSRLATTFVSLATEEPGVISNDAEGVHMKTMNNFFLPSATAETVESFCMINNTRQPQANTVGAKHHFMRLMQALGIWNSVSHACSISDEGYGSKANASRQFLAAFDHEMVPGAEASGVPVLGGGIVQLTLRNIGNPNRAFICHHYDSVLEIRSQGAIVYS